MSIRWLVMPELRQKGRSCASFLSRHFLEDGVFFIDFTAPVRSITSRYGCFVTACISYSVEMSK